jgi:hypothetical protein
MEERARGSPGDAGDRIGGSLTPAGAARRRPAAELVECANQRTHASDVDATARVFRLSLGRDALAVVRGPAGRITSDRE